MEIWWLILEKRGACAGRTQRVRPGDVEHFLHSYTHSRRQFFDLAIRAIVIQGFIRQVVSYVVRHGLEGVIVRNRPVPRPSV